MEGTIAKPGSATLIPRSTRFQEHLDRVGPSVLAGRRLPLGLARWRLGPPCAWLAVLLGLFVLFRWDVTLMRWRFSLGGQPDGVVKQVFTGLREFSQLVPIATAVAIVYLGDRRRAFLISTLLLALGVGALGCYTVRLCLPRYRPCAAMRTVAQASSGSTGRSTVPMSDQWLLNAHPDLDGLLARMEWNQTWAGGQWRSNFNTSSFPSGHSYAAFAFAAVLAWFYPHLRVVFWTLAIGCSLSRLVDAVHWPSDCLAGAVIGYAAAWIALRACAWALPDHAADFPGLRRTSCDADPPGFSDGLAPSGRMVNTQPHTHAVERPAGTACRHFAGRWAWTRRPVGLLLLLLVCLSVYVPGVLSLPPIDRDESRYAEASRHMVATGTLEAWLVPQIQGRPLLCKPPLMYWLQAATVWATGGREPAKAVAATVALASNGLPARGIWAYRLPSVLGALVAVALTWALGRSMFGGPVPWVAGVLLGTCLVMMTSLRQACTDQVLLAFTMLAQLALWHIWRRPQPPGARAWGWPILLWVAIALGLLTKGPVTPAVAAWTAIALCLVSRQWQWMWRLRPGVGMVIGAAIVVPWAMTLGGTIGWGRLLSVLKYEVLSRSLTPLEGHAGFPGLHALLLVVLLWPGSLALAPALQRAFKRGLRLRQAGRDRGKVRRVFQTIQRVQAGRPAELFCLAWLLPGWLAFELVATKLPHYTLPLYPALALLCARGLLSVPAWRCIVASPLGRFALVGWILLSGVLLLLAPMVAAVTGEWRPPVSALPGAVGLGLVMVVSFGLLIQAARAGRFVRMQVCALTGGGALVVMVFHFILPHLATLWLSSRVLADVQRLDPGARAPLASVGYQEDSLVFLSGGRVARLKWVDLRGWLNQHPDGLAVVEESPLVPSQSIERLVRRTGFNYSKGEWVNVALIRAAASGAGRSPAAAGG